MTKKLKGRRQSDKAAARTEKKVVAMPLKSRKSRKPVKLSERQLQNGYKFGAAPTLREESRSWGREQINKLRECIFASSAAMGKFNTMDVVPFKEKLRLHKFRMEQKAQKARKRRR